MKIIQTFILTSIIALACETTLHAQSDQTSHSVVENKLITAISDGQKADTPPRGEAASQEQRINELSNQISLLKQQIGGPGGRVSSRQSIDRRLKDLEREVKDLDRRIRKLENMETRLRRVERKL